MTQQQMSKLLDLPERTLRDWKSSRNRLYTLLENIEYSEAKHKIDVVDLTDEVEFNPNEFSINLFWQTNRVSKQNVYAIISNYLSTLNPNDIQKLCLKFGKNMVKSVLDEKYKSLYKKGFITTSGMDILIQGKYNQNPIYKQILKMINDF